MRGSQREAQRELRVLAILALTLRARLAPCISLPIFRLDQRRSARMARSARVDLVAELQCRFARRRYEILTRRRVQNAARRADDQTRAGSGLPALHCLCDVAALRTNSWYQEWHVAYDLADFG